MDSMKDWNNWKDMLGRSVDLGQSVGLSDESINTIAEKIGTFLSNNIDPRNEEERLLKTLWDAADERDRKVLAKLMVKISDK